MSNATTPTTQKAIKQHRCSWCGESIAPGESYARWRYFADGDAVTVKMHHECELAQQAETAETGENEFELHAQARGVKA
jgi:hypothetical protein